MERLDPRTTAILVVDVQEKLATAMPQGRYTTLLRNVRILLETAHVLGVPVLVSEQYPKGLGPTVPEIAALLHGVVPLPKTTFDACSDLAIARALNDRAPRGVVVVGMEAHVCVFQTARELVKRGFSTHVVPDAVCSRTEDNRELGLSLCERAGASRMPTESVVFDLLERAGTPEFKRISALIR